MSKLDGRVAAVNEAHLLAMQLEKQLREFFLAYVGQKVLKADGTVLAKIAAKLNPLLAWFDNQNGVQVYLDRGPFYLRWTVKVRKEADVHSWVYWEQSVRVGEIEGDTLKNVIDKPTELRTDYTAEEIEAKRKVYRELMEQAERAKYELFPFGERD